MRAELYLRESVTSFLGEGQFKMSKQLNVEPKEEATVGDCCFGPCRKGGQGLRRLKELISQGAE